jgi:hypothetical protein
MTIRCMHGLGLNHKFSSYQAHPYACWKQDLDLGDVEFFRVRVESYGPKVLKERPNQRL